MRFLSAIYVYPVKGLKGISLQDWVISEKGLKHDRNWMLADADGNFLSQRILPEMCLLETSLSNEGIVVTAPDSSRVLLPFQVSGNLREVKVWDDTFLASSCSENLDEWFSEKLKIKCHLVQISPDSKRQVAGPDHQPFDFGFADAYPVLLTSEASLQELNSRLPIPVEMNRFRPNLVFTGGLPFEEDGFDEFFIGEAGFRAVKGCGRCQVITVDPQSGIKGLEPLKTLSIFRTKENKVMFGENCISFAPGSRIKVGEELKVVSFKKDTLNA